VTLRRTAPAALVLATVLAAWPSPSRAQAVVPAVPAVGPQAAVPAIAPQVRFAPVPLLWAAEREGHVVYLLGSFHLLAPDDYPLSPEVDAAFADAESLLFEMSPPEMASPTLATRMAQAALRTDGTRLDAELPDATRRKLDDWVRANAARLAGGGITAQGLQLFEPWFAGLVVGIVGMGDTGLDPALGLDRHFAEAAVAAGKRVDGLETGDQQIAFLDGMDRAEQLQFLDEALSDALPGDDDNATLHAQWRAGDADGMWEKLGGELRRDYPRLYQRIDVDRNTAWLPVIEQRLQGPGDDDTLVVVGTLHLLGPDGLVERLRAGGYVVRRICAACDAAQPPAGTSTMQSTGQAGTHSSQPVQSGSTTACMSLAPPTMASTGQAWMHLVQPMQSSSTTSATWAGLCAPRARSKGIAATPSTRARARAPASPPGGQRSGPASPRAMASA
jgi:uncharacterized protein YbaP (TraB family)